MIKNLLNKLDNLKLDKKKLVLIIAISLFVLYIDLSLIIKWQLRGIRNTSQQIVKLNADIKEFIFLQDIKKKQLEAQHQGAIKIKRLISEEQIPSLLQNISNIGHNTNMKIIQICPSKETDAKRDPKLMPVLIKLDLSGNYHDFGRFINEIENSEEYMEAGELSILPGVSSYFQQRIRLVIKTYVKR